MLFSKIKRILVVLFLISILIVDADEAAAEGQYFAKGDEDGVMYLCQWWADEARQQHRAPEGAERNCRCQLKIFHIHSIKFCRLRRGSVALRGCAPSAGCVRSAQVVSALPRLPLRSSHHLPQGHPPRAACITSLIERHYLANGDTLLLLVCLPLLSEDIVVQ